MSDESQTDITQLLRQWGSGDQAALNELLPLVYAELRELAQRRLSRERPDHTLQRTALVNEAFLRLSNQRAVTWQNRAQFLGLASQMMRRILVDYARQRNAAKRGDAEEKLSLDHTEAALEVDHAQALEAIDALRDGARVDVVAIDAALARLEQLDAEQSRIVELRYFGGLTIEETAEVAGISPASVKREWALARAWLRRELATA